MTILLSLEQHEISLDGFNDNAVTAAPIRKCSSVEYPLPPIASGSAMGQQELILKRATRITPSGELKHDDYDVLCD